jgi:hypothetical protein
LGGQSAVLGAIGLSPIPYRARRAIFMQEAPEEKTAAPVDFTPTIATPESAAPKIDDSFDLSKCAYCLLPRSAAAVQTLTTRVRSSSRRNWMPHQGGLCVLRAALWPSLPPKQVQHDHHDRCFVYRRQGPLRLGRPRFLELTTGVPHLRVGMRRVSFGTEQLCRT